MPALQIVQSSRVTSLSIVIPVLNEAAGIAARLHELQPLRKRGTEVIVVDGGSSDDTAALAAPLCDRIVTAQRERAAQMNAGASAAHGDILLFLHADTGLPSDADHLITEALASRDWGRFDVTITGRHAMLAVIAFMMNLRSRLSGVATGDQAIFVRREVFRSTGGFPGIALMEDIALSKMLRRRSPPACLQARVTTSGRRWEKNGIWRTILLMWRLRLAYFIGANPSALAVRYGYQPRE